MEGSEEVLEAKPGLFYSIFNLGIIVHELAHYLGAVLVGAKVYKVVLLDNRGGLVVHEHVRPFESWIIALMPFLVCNLVAFFLFADATRAFGSASWIYFTVTLWLGISTAIYSDPSPTDLRAAWKLTGDMWSKSNEVEKIAFLIILPFVYLTLMLMELKQQMFSGRIGCLLWTAIIAVLAKGYVSTLG